MWSAVEKRLSDKEQVLLHFHKTCVDIKTIPIGTVQYISDLYPTAADLPNRQASLFLLTEIMQFIDVFVGSSFCCLITSSSKETRKRIPIYFEGNLSSSMRSLLQIRALSSTSKRSIWNWAALTFLDMTKRPQWTVTWSTSSDWTKSWDTQTET